ncbi:efflux RND transporter permease subunit [Provencibacterium massiliense]|uniref:efflux RND transporter permease subunit n=1 Tax=Provencibacterium massiliense TaxID=1841868 RepID=UPI0009A8BBC6|nr:efflux RND transporter permease subunit [Provencibacterium massiliense]RGB66747.1 AcrB/AcrD/AcrF family protein [Harryflintia acetispora]
MNLTKLALRRPVAIFVCILALVIYGVSSIFGMEMEQTPQMEMPMLMVRASYSNAGPEDVEELVTSVIEDAVGSLDGLKSMTSTSSEGNAMVALEFEYGTDTEEVKTDLQDKLNQLERQLPDDVEPSIMEMSMNQSSVMSLYLDASENSDSVLYYAENEVQPELEAVSGVASVEVMGGKRQYIRIQLDEEKLGQYNLTMSDVSSAIASADFSTPAGTIGRGDQDITLKGGEHFDTYESLAEVPITLQSGDIIYLQDVADIQMAEDENSSISRARGRENVMISIDKNQSASAVTISSKVQDVIASLNAANPDKPINVMNDSGETIRESLMSVASTLVLGVIITMAVLLVFFGDIKASLIVGTSMPFSLLTTLIIMSYCGLTLNTLSMGGLVIGIGMMVDNSIVVLESCFRRGDVERDFTEAALEGTRLVASSVVASTITTVVVFLPISMMEGMAGQMFKHMGYTIIFALTASLISALTLIPLLFCRLKPREHKGRITRVMERIENAYGRLIARLLNLKALVILVAVSLLVVSGAMVTHIDTELMPMMDQGSIQISVETKPALKTEKVSEILAGIEAILEEQPDIDEYSVRSGSGSSSISVYLKDDRSMETGEMVDLLREQTADMTDCKVSVSAQSGMSIGGNAEVTVQLTGKDLTQLEEAASQVAAMMKTHEGIVSTSTSLSDGNPQAEIVVDSLTSRSLGLTPSQIMSTVSNMISGTTATTITQDGEEYSVRVVYPEGTYEDVSDLEGVMLKTGSGSYIPLMDVASIEYSNAPQSLQKLDGKYLVEVSGQTRSDSAAKTSSEVSAQAMKLSLPEGVSLSMGGDMRSMNEEFSAIYTAIASAIFLVFMVMAIQFNSIRFSLVVLISVPFCAIGAFAALLIAGSSINMASLIGFVQLAGTVVNNAIVLIDYTNTLRREQGLSAYDALCQAGRTRLRPIMMTTLTTVLSLIPLAMGIGTGTETMQSLGVVVIGGLISSTFLTLILIPTFYLLFCGKDGQTPKKRNFHPIRRLRARFA